ncbi:MAG TPA: hypothetical protein VFL41_11160 [Gaiellaceae bacterium]|nr:hypothetical protein [Gaiellaceae bacterium]
MRIAAAISSACLMVAAGCGSAETGVADPIGANDPGLIVFNGFSAPDGSFEPGDYWTMRPDGSELQPLDVAWVDEVAADELSFSPGGRFVAALTYRGDVVISRPDGSEPRVVSVPQGRDAAWPSVSPDGTRLALVLAEHSPPWSRDLWTAAVGSDSLTRLSSKGRVENTAWSPDGAQIAFASGYLDDIYVVRADGSDLRYLARGGEPAWSPDGRRVAFSNAGGGVSVVDSGGGTPEVVSRKGRTPSWSPDGKRIAFLHTTPTFLRGTPCGHAACYRIFIVDAGGGQARPIGPRLAEADFLAWTAAPTPSRT